MTDYDTHYDKLDSLYTELGTLDGAYCHGNHDFTGWYNERAGRARAWCLGKEYGGIKDNLEDVIYATVSYTRRGWFVDSWTEFSWTDDSREWHGETPMPDYADIEAYAPFADIDLADDVKQRRPDGEIPQEKIESALAMYADGFAELAGDMSHVFALDSVGGAYMMLAPTTTAPIADAVDRNQRELLIDDMGDKLNDWLGDLDAAVLDAHPELDGVFGADCVNHKNRLYKAPMSIHSSLDGVVTPVDPASPDYSYTPLKSVTRDERERAEAWADWFTDDHTDAVGSVVATLWPDQYADADSWRGAVKARAQELEEQQEEYNGSDGTDLDADEIPDDLETTDDIEVINKVIEGIDVRDVARDVADEWDTAPNRSGPTRFAASWHNDHDSGTSCFATRDKFVDLSEGKKGGGALRLVARADKDIDLNDCRESIGGAEMYWKAVAKLRGMGYEIPRFKGADGKHPDYLGLYDDVDTPEEQRKQVAKALKR